MHIPKDMQNDINDLKKTKTRFECLKTVKKIIDARFYGRKFYTYWFWYKLFIRDLAYVWNHPGFWHCMTINRMTKFLLLKSGHFKEEDIKTRWTLFFLSPHQYLEINLGDRVINVDLWSSAYGLKLGEYAHGMRKI